MLDNAPEHKAIRELETLVRHLADELAAFRRRAFIAEAKLKEPEGATPRVGLEMSQRVHELEQANELLKDQLNTVTARTKQMLDRVRFLRQQVQGGGGSGR